MVSFAASRLGHSMLTFELASRSRSLAFTVVSVERQRQHPQSIRQFHNTPQHSTYRSQGQDVASQQRQRSALVQPFSTQTPRFQAAAAPQPASSSPSPPPPHSPPPAQSTTSSSSSHSSTPASSTESISDAITDITASGLSDAPPPPAYSPDPDPTSTPIDWARSFHGLSTQPFSEECSKTLLAPVDPADVEIKPDGIVYLPEIKYRRILNRAFGPGGWGLAPRSETIVTAKCVTREYALLAHGRLVSVARGEQEYFDREGIPTATEGCKSNALMRCCKDLGVASELWDPRFIRKFMKEWAKEVWVEHVTTKKRRKITIRKDESVQYPWKETKLSG